MSFHFIKYERHCFQRGALQKAFEQLEKLIEYIKHSAGLVKNGTN